jgi:hypothetical protein
MEQRISIRSMSGMRKPPSDPSPRQLGCCLLISLGSIIGFVLGGLHGIREYRAAVDAAVKDGLTADYLPVGIPIWAIVGALLGALASGLLLSGWRLVSRPVRARNGDIQGFFRKMGDL